MKRIYFILMLLVMSATTISQTSQLPYRVVSVSPNYPNLYPRFNTLQATYTAIKDSAKVSTGKYFIVNVTTSYNNISDWSGTYKDSILNRDPYMKLVSFGQAVNDSIIGVTTQEFQLLAGILSLNSATAGDGLSFSSHKYSINVTNYLGNALYLDGDSLKLRLTGSLEFTPNLLGVNLAYNSGIRLDTGGLLVGAKLPLKINRDTLKILFATPFIAGDSVYLNYDSDVFSVLYGVSPAFFIKTDSGLSKNSNGLQIIHDNRISFLTNNKLTLPALIAGYGLIWTGDSLGIQTHDYPYPLRIRNDSLLFIYNPDFFDMNAISGFYIRTDSGMTSNSSGLQLLLDPNEMSFTSSGELQVASTLAGDGLVKAGDAIKVLPNEYAKLENDTLKIKTSDVLYFYGDSLTANVTSGLGVLPFDSTGVSMFASGKIKRAGWTFQLASGNDTTKTQINNVAFSSGDKIRVIWVNASSRFTIQTWTLASRSWTNQITLDATGFANKKWRIGVEYYEEAQ